ncbi:hypothetical protein [Streptomyces sp. NPDC002490]|uniref:hypothetical protein n=1 Tax=Streptomyces sp. NPDC002490 TaxID=3154416 RepID=UPI00332601CF
MSETSPSPHLRNASLASPSQSGWAMWPLSCSAASLMASRAFHRAVPAFSSSAGLAFSTRSTMSLRRRDSKSVRPGLMLGALKKIEFSSNCDTATTRSMLLFCPVARLRS